MSALGGQSGLEERSGPRSGVGGGFGGRDRRILDRSCGER